MKLVVAIIKPHRVEAVTEALDKLDVSGITLTEVRGHGRQRGHTEVYRGSEYKVDFLPKVRIDVLVKDGEAEKVANVIVAEAAHRPDRRRQALGPAGRHRRCASAPVRSARTRSDAPIRRLRTRTESGPSRTRGPVAVPGLDPARGRRGAARSGSRHECDQFW